MIENGWRRALAKTRQIGRALARDPVGQLVATAAAAGDSGPTAALLAVRGEVDGAPMRGVNQGGDSVSPDRTGPGQLVRAANCDLSSGTATGRAGGAPTRASTQATDPSE